MEERGIDAKRLAFGEEPFRFRAAGCRVSCVPIFWNKGVTKQGNYDFPPGFVSRIAGMLSGTHCSSSSFFIFFFLKGFESVQPARLGRLHPYKRARLEASACVSTPQNIYDALSTKTRSFPSLASTQTAWSPAAAFRRPNSRPGNKSTAPEQPPEPGAALEPRTAHGLLLFLAVACAER